MKQLTLILSIIGILFLFPNIKRTEPKIGKADLAEELPIVKPGDTLAFYKTKDGINISFYNSIGKYPSYTKLYIVK